MRRVMLFLCLIAVAPSRLQADGTYAQVQYQAGEVTPKMRFAVNYVLWLPDNVKQLRGIIIHQHGCGDGPSNHNARDLKDILSRPIDELGIESLEDPLA